MKNKVYKYLVITSVLIFTGTFALACGKKEDANNDVQVEIEKIDEAGNVITTTGDGSEEITADADNSDVNTENGQQPAANSKNEIKPGSNKSSFSVQITPGVPLTEDQMKKIAEEQQEMLKGITPPANPVNGNGNAPTELEPNFGPGEDEMRQKADPNPNLKPNFPDSGELKKQPTTDLKPNFPTDGQNAPQVGAPVPNITPSFPANGENKLPKSLPPDGSIDPSKGNFPTEGQPVPGAN